MKLSATFAIVSAWKLYVKSPALLPLKAAFKLKADWEN